MCLLLLARRDPEANAVLVRLERYPSYGPGWERLGQGLAPIHPAGARVAFERAAKAYAAGEVTADVAHRLGVVRRQLGDAAGARVALELAVARDPAHAAAWFLLGLVRQDDHEPAAAALAFRASLAARPNHHEAEFNLAVVLQEAGDVEAALDHYARAWRLRPGQFRPGRAGAGVTRGRAALAAARRPHARPRCPDLSGIAAVDAWTAQQIARQRVVGFRVQRLVHQLQTRARHREALRDRHAARATRPRTRGRAIGRREEEADRR